MQTDGERSLVSEVGVAISQQRRASRPSVLLDIGAGRSLSIEQQLVEAGHEFVCDRVDLDDCAVSHPRVRNCWQCSVEAMTPVASNTYDAAFANYVFEHVPRLDAAAAEVWRVLRPGGLFATTVPNSLAPEFLVSRLTPNWVHGRFKASKTWKTYYAYSSVGHFVRIFESQGLSLRRVDRYPCIGVYLDRFPVLAAIGRAYDKVVSFGRMRPLMGDVFVAFTKPG